MLLGLVGCSSAAPAPDPVGQAVASVTQVPAGVFCLRITVAGATTVTRTFDVMPGQGTVLTLSGLPAGTDTFVADALPVSCGDAGATAPSWASQPVIAVVAPGATVNVDLVLEPMAQGNVSVDCGSDGGGGDGGGGLPNVVSCSASGCVCVAGFADCDGTLTNGCETNLTSDGNNCGACGIFCPGGDCNGGKCLSLPETFSLTASNLNGFAPDCGSSGILSAVSGFGFRWQDGHSGSAIPKSVTISFAHSVQCQFPQALIVTFP